MTKIDAVQNAIVNRRNSSQAVHMASRERGVSLVVALIFLIILTILGFDGNACGNFGRTHVRQFT